MNAQRSLLHQQRIDRQAALRLRAHRPHHAPAQQLHAEPRTPQHRQRWCRECHHARLLRQSGQHSCQPSPRRSAAGSAWHAWTGSLARRTPSSPATARRCESSRRTSASAEQLCPRPAMTARSTITSFASPDVTTVSPKTDARGPTQPPLGRRDRHADLHGATGQRRRRIHRRRRNPRTAAHPLSFVIEVDDDAILNTKNHLLKFGTQLFIRHEHRTLTTNFNGTYTFGGGIAPVLDGNNQPTGADRDHHRPGAIPPRIA